IHTEPAAIATVSTLSASSAQRGITDIGVKNRRCNGQVHTKKYAIAWSIIPTLDTRSRLLTCAFGGRLRNINIAANANQQKITANTVHIAIGSLFIIDHAFQRMPAGAGVARYGKLNSKSTGWFGR